MRKKLEYELQSLFSLLKKSKYDKAMNFYQFKKFVSRLHLAHAMSIAELCDQNEDGEIYDFEAPCLDLSELSFIFMLDVNEDMGKRVYTLEQIWKRFEQYMVMIYEELDVDYVQGVTVNTKTKALATASLQIIPVIHALVNCDPSHLRTIVRDIKKWCTIC